MEFQRLNRTDPERIFVVVQNSYSTASFSDGQWAAWDLVTDKDGVAITKPNGQLRAAVAGVVVETIAHGNYGLMQVWGYKSNARCLGGTGLGTSKISNATPLAMVTSGFAAQAIAQTSNTIVGTDYARFPCGLGIEPLNTAAIATQAGTSGAYEVFVKCL